jgi:hypothetical protein
MHAIFPFVAAARPSTGVRLHGERYQGDLSADEDRDALD